MAAFKTYEFFSEKKGGGDVVTKNVKMKNFSPTLKQHFTRGWIRIDFWIRIRQNVPGINYFRYRILIRYPKSENMDTVS
jgi:hypothetical protein